ncbi:MAG: cysteine hydrolase [Myxococcota bacterium]
MSTSDSAVLLIGFQNDYFSEDGILHSVVENNVRANGVLENTLRLLRGLEGQACPFINLPILFSPDYEELSNPSGLLAKIKEVGAFRRDTEGGKTIPELEALGERVIHLYGKTGFNAFLGTGLDEFLQSRGVRKIYLTGVVTSVCLDSTGRAASELGYEVTVISNASAGRSEMEHAFYCSDVFPLYAQVEDVDAVLEATRADAA